MLDNFQKFLDYLKTLLKSLHSYLIVQLVKLYYLLFKKDYYHYLELSFEDFKFSWRWTDHFTYTQEKELALKQLKPTLAPPRIY